LESGKKQAFSLKTTQKQDLKDGKIWESDPINRLKMFKNKIHAFSAL